VDSVVAVCNYLSRRWTHGAVDTLNEAVKLQPTNAEVNYLLGEAYLQLKKGSKAVLYLYEALKLEPIKMADAH